MRTLSIPILLFFPNNTPLFIYTPEYAYCGIAFAYYRHHFKGQQLLILNTVVEVLSSGRWTEYVHDRVVVMLQCVVDSVVVWRGGWEWGLAGEVGPRRDHGRLLYDGRAWCTRRRRRQRMGT